MNESGENALFRKNGVPKFQTHEMEKEGDTDLPTFSEAPEISSKIYDNILELDSLTTSHLRAEAGNSVLSGGNGNALTACGEVQAHADDYPGIQEVNENPHSNKKEGVGEEQFVGEPQDNHPALSIPNLEELGMATRRGFMQELIQETHKNTLEHKQTNFLCLEEILKKMDLMIQLQMKITQSVASHREERQLLFQHIYELKKQVADKAFNSLCNKDLARRCVQSAQTTQKKDIAHSKTKPTSCVELQREKYNPTQNFDVFTKGTKNTRLFFFHLSELEECVYSFTHFCRDMSTRICPSPEGGCIHSDLLDQGFFSFLRDPQAMRLIRDLEKNLTRIKSMCMQN
ncbi:conserved Plasmodium protein, unknown function [Plasmodium knowlesi strain H]|uniref:Uncharacterized protein n=3 Tax=Plasmodium knowlesi TaxID=5850 RepID=A0A5E7WV29_PLAKH|nr:conserved Plasmodium protein, unknown function [Plasmodium knowlesi strain H]OTN68652.1 Uncharacterized protein PKNOH_S01024600 [Plasmodium knowlesi]CAA9986243.1 conserved Plasmodium protein, unknown function [Plasmodium knowlesi strain H]SBO25454.1 conserved Plasmodium protein, unknown function [Plasmodium knowlesi strain H]SBO27733.1 conserved Plasmodium protein, unknown function [Plasmodium knowlesi strain H]VVS75717.1 conserved Plasmodium protein, unknown function [Plasmodium knowlesi s